MAENDKVLLELTAAGTVNDFHVIPYYIPVKENQLQGKDINLNEMKQNKKVPKKFRDFKKWSVSFIQLLIYEKRVYYLKLFLQCKSRFLNQ